LAKWYDQDEDGEYKQYGIAVSDGFEEDEDEVQPESGLAADEGRDGAAGDAVRGVPAGDNSASGATAGVVQAGRKAAQAVLQEVVDRMLKIEANEARRAAKKPKEFLTWLETFYATHVQRFQTAILPALSNWLAVHKLADWQ